MTTSQTFSVSRVGYRRYADHVLIKLIKVWSLRGVSVYFLISQNDNFFSFVFSSFVCIYEHNALPAHAYAG